MVRFLKGPLVAFVGSAALVSALLAIPWPRRAEPLIEASARGALPEMALTDHPDEKQK